MAKMTKEEKKAAKAAKKANSPKNAEFTNTVIKSVVAVICAAAICITATNCIGKIADAKISAAETVAKAYETNGTADENGTATDSGTTDSGTTDVPVEGEDATEATADNGTTEEETAAGGNATGTETKSGSSAPKTTAEVLNYYNTATAKVAKAAVPFTKDRNTAEKKFDAGLALKPFKGLVYKFMGVGDGNKFSKTVTAEDKDSYHKYFKASALKESDVVSATCTEAGGNYTITIKIKDGASSVKGGKVVNSNNAPLDRSGLACGDNDKDYWDHKTAENIYSAIADVAKSADISEQYSNAVITAVVNAKTGNIVSVSAKFDFHVDLANVYGASGTAEASSTVNMKNFKW